MKTATKQSKTEKILWAIFGLMKLIDDIYHFAPGARRVYSLSNVEYREIMRKIQWRKSRNRFAKFINDLKRRGYLKTRIEKDKRAVILTPKGVEKALKITLERSDKKKRKDGKWQMIIWDVPENYKKTRNRFRDALKLLGYQQLQESVWICPYSVLKETECLIRFYGVESYVRLFLISEVEM